MYGRGYDQPKMGRLCMCASAQRSRWKETTMDCHGAQRGVIPARTTRASRCGPPSVLLTCCLALALSGAQSAAPAPLTDDQTPALVKAFRHDAALADVCFIDA